MSIKFIQFDNSVNSTIYPRQTNVNIARIRVVEIIIQRPNLKNLSRDLNLGRSSNMVGST